MVKFETMSQTKAELDSATGKWAEIMVEYLGYLNQLKEGEAGMLTVSGSDESPTALRRRIGKAAQASGKEIVIRRKDDAIYFWLDSGVTRRRRARKDSAPSTSREQMNSSRKPNNTDLP